MVATTTKSNLVPISDEETKQAISNVFSSPEYLGQAGVDVINAFWNSQKNAYVGIIRQRGTQKAFMFESNGKTASYQPASTKRDSESLGEYLTRWDDYSQVLIARQYRIKPSDAHEICDRLDSDIRFDVGKRKCTPISYACGRTCLSVHKTCRVAQNSAIGKERLNKLKSLADNLQKGRSDPRKGIGKTSPQDLQEQAKTIESQRSNKASTLKLLKEYEPLNIDVKTAGDTRLKWAEKKLNSSIKDLTDKLKEHGIHSTNSWGETVHLGSLPGHEKEYSLVRKHLQNAKKQHGEVRQEILLRDEKTASSPDTASNKLKQRQRKQQVAAEQAAKKQERQANLKAKETVSQSFKKLPSIEQSLSEIKSPETKANLRRRLEQFSEKDGTITQQGLDRAINAVSGSSSFKESIKKKLQKMGVFKDSKQLDSSVFLDVVKNKQLTAADRAKAINEVAQKMGISQDEAYSLYKEARDNYHKTRRSLN